jgi:hypothetical protein
MTIAGSKRKHGGVPRNIDYLRASLVGPNPEDEAAKPGAIIELSALIGIAIDQTILGDAECGYLLAELLAYLSKNQNRLSAKNEIFRKTYSRWESSRLATKKGSPLRALIHDIIVDASREKRVQEIAKLIPHSSLVIKRNKTLLAVPEFGNSPDAIAAWTEKIVYPRLRAKQADLENHPVIGQLAKAKDPNGKFRLSRLKPLVRQTVARIAAVPKSYYFPLW